MARETHRGGSRSRSPSSGDRKRSRRSGSSRSDRNLARDSKRSRSRSRSGSESHRRESRDRPMDKSSATEREERHEEEDQGSHAIPKAQVTESNGEVSCSIEETNRIRAMLGLKPLDLQKGTKAERQAIENSRKAEEERRKVEAENEARRRLEKARKQRLLNKKAEGKSLGESLAEDENYTSALDWVKRSRTQEKAKTEEEARKRKAREEAEEEEESESDDDDAGSRGPAAAQTGTYSTKNLKGLKIRHDLDSFDEGSSVVLTLKDSSVLAEDGSAVADAEDELENALLAENEKLKEKKRKERRAKRPIYSAYDDEEFLTPASVPKKKTILSHYDEEEVEAELEAKRGFKLNAEGTAEASLKDHSEVSSNGSGGKVQVHSLAVDKKKAVREYYTQEEIAAKFAKRKKLRKKSLRKKKDKIKLEDELQPLPHEENVSATHDRGSRKERNAVDAKHKEEAAKEASKMSAFLQARQKANERAGQLRKNIQDEIEEDDVDLAESLARARRLAQLRAKAEAKVDAERAAAVAARARAAGNDAAAATSASSTTSGSRASAGDGESEGEGGGSLVFSSTTEFSRRLQARMSEQARQAAQSSAGRSQGRGVAQGDVDMEQAGESEGSGSAPASRAAAQQGESDRERERRRAERGVSSSSSSSSSTWVEVGDEDEAAAAQDQDGDEESFGREQPLVGKGMAATLQLLRTTGDLRERTQERQFGRANDTRLNLQQNDPAPNIKLEYRDDFGRALTVKEAYRQLSYKFHGQKQGKKNQERRLRRLMEEIEAEKKLSGEHVPATLSALQKQQEAQQQAYLVLSGAGASAAISSFQEQLKKS